MQPAAMQFLENQHVLHRSSLQPVPHHRPPPCPPSFSAHSDRPRHKVVIQFDTPVDAVVRKRIYSSVYAYIRKRWEDIEAVKSLVSKYMAREAAGDGHVPDLVKWGPHILFTSE